MTTQPKALRLADALQAGADDPMWADHCEMSKRTVSLAAAELRRLSADIDLISAQADASDKECARLEAVNEELLGFLKVIGDTDPVDARLAPERLPRIARAAIAKTGEQA